MASIVERTGRVLGRYNDLLIEQPSPRRVKRFLLAVNGWCNSRCTFCNIWQYPKATALSEEVTLAELERNLFSAAVLADVLDVGLTGGEPFLRRDLAAVCQSIYTHFSRAHLGVVTNGLLPARVAETAAAISAASPGRELSVAVSLDGYGERHDAVRGVPGNFERVLDTIARLKERAPEVSLGFSHTVTPANLADSVRCYELSRELGIGFIYRLAHQSPYLRNQADEPMWSDAAVRAAAPVVAELNRRLLADQRPLTRLANVQYASTAFYARTLDYVAQPRRTFDCFSGTHSFFLAHTGEVHPCINLTHSMGNIRQQPFDEVWFGNRASDVREPIAAWQCHCWTNCETELSLARRKSAFVQSLGANLGLSSGEHPRQ